MAYQPTGVTIIECAAFILGQVDWPGGVRRVMLTAATPAKVLARSKSPNDVLRRWLKLAQRDGLLRYATVFVKPLDRKRLVEIATANAGAWRATDFMDTAKARAEIDTLLRNPRELGRQSTQPREGCGHEGPAPSRGRRA